MKAHTQYQMVFILHIYIRRVTEFGSLPSIFVVAVIVFCLLVYFVIQFTLTHTRTHIFCLVSAGVKCCKLFYEGEVAAFH